MKKSLVLVTAQWGWSVDKKTAFSLLDDWLSAGYTEIDAATNYPINQQPTDFKAAERMLIEYVKAHGLQRTLAITMKVGSMDNMRTPDINLSPSFVLMMAHEYRRELGDNLHGIMLHWDHRSDETAIHETLSALFTLQQEGLQPGLSGIKYPEVYAASKYLLPFHVDLEVKHNVFVSDLAHYRPLLQDVQNPPRVLAYGINAGGLKFSHQQISGAGTFALRGGQISTFQAQLVQIEAKIPTFNLAFVRPPIVTLNHLGMIYALCHPKIDGAIIGARTPAQLHEAITWHQNTDVFDYSDVVRSVGLI